MIFLKTIKRLFKEDKDDGAKYAVPYGSPKQRVRLEKDVPKQHTDLTESPKHCIGRGVKHDVGQPDVQKRDSRPAYTVSLATKRDAPNQHIAKPTTTKRDNSSDDSSLACNADGAKHSNISSADVTKCDASSTVFAPGFHEAWEANQLWDKHRETEAVKLYEQALAAGFKDDDKLFYHLGCYYIKRKDWKNLKRILSFTPKFVLTQRWAIESKRLIEQHLGKMPNGWIDIEMPKTENDNEAKTWLQEYERLTSAFPLFDFDMGNNEAKIRDEDRAALHEFEMNLERKRQNINSLMEAKDYRKAAELLAEFIRNGYWKPWPYEMLMDIYAKAELQEERKRLAHHAARFFSIRREEMKGRAYGAALNVTTGGDYCMDFVKNCIKDGKRIAYYDGLFDVYNPYPETEEWRKFTGG